MKVFNLSMTALTLLTATLTGCGGGGGGGGSNNTAAITGTSSGNVSVSSTTASGALAVTDPDAGQATFAQPASLSGNYGTWSVTISGATASWGYTLDTSKTPSNTATDSLVIKSLDGSASQTLTVNIAAGSTNTSASGLITTVPDAVYTGTYASEKLAVFNRLNADRARCGFGKMAQNTKLDLAAQNHADYIALNKIANTHYQIQGRPGFTGTDPGARLQSVGYQWSWYSEILGQQVWGTWYSSNPDFAIQQKSALVTLKGLYGTVYHLAGAMGRTTEIGIGISNFAYNNDASSNGKTLNIDMSVPSANASQGQLLPASTIATFPCDGTTNLSPAFKAEDPDPFPGVDRNSTPYGQPVYISSGWGTTINLTSGSMTLRDGSAVPTTVLNSTNDPQKRLLNNQVFLVPTTRLADNATYDVSLAGTSTGLVSASNPIGAWTRTFSFTTGTVLSE